MLLHLGIRNQLPSSLANSRLVELHTPRCEVEDGAERRRAAE